MNQLDLAPEAFTARLAQQGGRAYIVRDRNGGLRASHGFLGELVEFLRQDKRDHLEHEALFFEVGPETGALLTAFVHQTTRGQGAGGVRHWAYARLEDLLRDGLRLSVGMTRKNALAGLWWGGAKGIIAREPGERYRDPEYRRQLYREYGSFISSLRGCYVTAEDAGTTPPDMLEVFSRTRHTTCIPPAFGGSGNPSEPTAKGVLGHGSRAGLPRPGHPGGQDHRHAGRRQRGRFHDRRAARSRHRAHRRQRDIETARHGTGEQRSR